MDLIEWKNYSKDDEYASIVSKCNYNTWTDLEICINVNGDLGVRKYVLVECEGNSVLVELDPTWEKSVVADTTHFSFFDLTKPFISSTGFRSHFTMGVVPEERRLEVAKSLVESISKEEVFKIKAMQIAKRKEAQYSLFSLLLNGEYGCQI